MRARGSTLAAAAVLVTAACGDPSPPADPGRSAAHPAARDARPNVLLIVMDTTRADRCSVHGYGRPTTPALERLAADGVVFDSAWSTSSWTVPTHASLFTGLLPHRHGADTDLRTELPQTAVTLAELLRDAGYATGGFSNNHFVSDEFGLAQGFTTFRPLFRERQRPYPTAAPTHDEVLRWARSQHEAGRPFFAFVNDMEPHAPYTPPEDVEARFLRGPVDAGDHAWARAFEFPLNLPAIVGIAPPRPARLALLGDLYDAEIATLDAEIGRLLDGLRSAGLLDETLVVVTSDHGELLGENGRVAHSLSLAAPLLRVPLVLRHPRHFTGGRRVPDVVRLQDLFPTVLEVCGVPVPGGIDAETLTGAVAGRTATARLGRPRSILAACRRELPGVDVSHHDVVLRSATDGRHQLIVRGTGETAHAALYDLVADPRGETDLAAREPAVVARLRALLPD